ncbi:hypothetical protein IFR09_20445 [Pseudomonas syringae]|nr:hypothetical protein [Pseudomonas syringae]MBD8576899.1 hypothetical protein [Pseudomonas syringae]MBD8792068.1 hypothetical protein [Pseudomonas syringae]MBD8801292.1 hypothetical protein [Pseudomonas syringae]MBD8813533.1 hypothetical protein [Pseudomonas syringae]
MSVIQDQDFGELHFDGIWQGVCEVVFLGRRLDVELVIQTFDDAPISQTQRLAYREFVANKASICAQVEEAILKHYLDHLCAYRACFDAHEVDAKAPSVREVEGMRDLVCLRCIKVMYAFDEGVRQVGFIGDATFDPELGLGVLVTNGFVEAVDTQDFLLG